MKWGVRRYQNADGTRTSLGKKRESKEYRITQKKEGNNLSAKRVKKNMNNMSDKELREALNRLNMQQEVNRMNPNHIEKGRQRLARFAAVVGAISAAVIASDKVVGWVSPHIK